MSFLSAKERVEIDLASLFSQHLVVPLSLAAEPRPFSCEVETDLFLIAPDAKQKDARVVRVTADNCSRCLSIWKESEVFKFDPLLQHHQFNPEHTMARGELEDRQSN